MTSFIWDDPDDGLRYEMRYIVTQHEDEGPEYVEWRFANSDDPWQRLPPWATPPAEAMEFWHGPVIHFWEVQQEGIIVAMRDAEPSALCVNAARELFVADLTVFENITNPDGDEVKPGDAIRVDNAEVVKGPEELRTWLNA